jgi:putative ABC transport system permease protein
MLALAIGANTAIYSVAKAVVFAPLPFPQPQQLVLIFEGERGERFQPGVPMNSVRPGTFQDWHDQSRSFERMAAVFYARETIVNGESTAVLDGFRVSEGFFETLGVGPRLGRYFTARDYAEEGQPIVVLADRLWRQYYNADPAIVGREIVLNGASHRVIGVMPSGFLPTISGNDPQFWIPLRWDPATKHSFTTWGMNVYARLNNGVTIAQAQAEMETVTARMRAAHPRDYEWTAIIAPFDKYLFGRHERLFFLLLATAVGLVLLIACANVANLLLARALKRQREFAVRAALGASRGAILRQVLAESTVIALVGGLAGVAVSPLLTRPALALLPAGNLPRLDRVAIDGNVLAFTLVISLLAGLCFGIMPALRAGSGDLSVALRSGGRGSSPTRNERRLSDALIVAEIALSLVLLVAGGMLARAFLKLLRTDPGFRPAQSVAVRISVPTYGYGAYEAGGENASRRALYERLEQSARSIPGVEDAGVTLKVPLRQFWNPDALSIEGRPPALGRDGTPMIDKRWGIAVQGEASMQTASAGYFAALGMSLVRGRVFDARDRPGAPMSAIVNDALVRKFFPTEDPIGRHIAVDSGLNFLRRMIIVGVVADARLDGLDKPALPEVFAAMPQSPAADVWIVARARADADSIAGALRRVVHDIDSEIGIVEVATMASVVSDSLWRERFSALLVGLFAALAAVIAAGGLYAVISHAVERRAQELGVRIALGAGNLQIAGTVFRHGGRVTAIGIVAGAAITVAIARVWDQQVYQAEDLPWMIATVSGFLVFLTLLACVVPLRKALAVDPLTALRSE